MFRKRLDTDTFGMIYRRWSFNGFPANPHCGEKLLKLLTVWKLKIIGKEKPNENGWKNFKWMKMDSFVIKIALESFLSSSFFIIKKRENNF